jgi:UDP-2-acetamido-3-amino-2,3-dideoxy-glucuronate N-acetyltransferase
MTLQANLPGGNDDEEGQSDDDRHPASSIRGRLWPTVACPSASTREVVGESSSACQGLVVPITGGTPGSAQATGPVVTQVGEKAEPWTERRGAVDSARIHATADVDEGAKLGPRTTVWHLAQVRENAELGSDCIVGRGAYVGPGVVIGDNVKLQNYALVYEPARLEDAVFIGPAAVLTNDVYPRSTDVTGKLKRPADWDALGVTVRQGASVGARVVIVAGVVVGRWALVAAGAVVTRDIPDFALVAGVPARRIGWVGRAGSKLVADGDHRWRCPETGDRYEETDGLLTLVAEQGHLMR